MNKTKRSSLKADPLYFKAFRIRNSPDPSPKSINVMPAVDGTSEIVDTSPTQQRRTIKLVQPSPPQSSTPTIASRSVSAESQASQSNMADGSGTDHQKELSGSSSKADKSGKMDKTSSKSYSKTSHVPIYEHFTPSRGSTDSEQRPQSRIVSPALSPIATFSTRASSPGGSDDSLQLPPHLRSGGSGGKSGRVIDKLASENSRLHRELNEKTARLEEAQRTHETDTIAIQEAKESAMRHQHLYETNEAILMRRDRKVEELKEALNAEKIRREHAEKERREMAEVLKSEMSSTAKQLATEQEKRLHYEAQYKILEQAYRKGKSPWQPYTEKLNTKMDGIAASLKELHENQNQVSAHQSQVDDIHQQMVVLFEEYKREKHNLLGPVADRINENEQAADQLLEEMTETLHKMKWVIAVKKNVKDT